MTRGSPEMGRDDLDRMPGWAAPVVYLLVTGVLFREFLFSDLMLLGQDTLALGYVARAFFAEALASTGFPLWNPQILGGTPFLDSLAGGDSLYPPSLLLLLLFDTHRALGWKLILHVFLAGCFMYGWLRAVGVSRGAGLVGGLAWLLAPCLVTLVYPGHDGKLFVTALTPLVFWLAEWSVARRGLLPLAALGGAVALVILTTHFQMAYFLFGAVGVYMAFRCVQVGREDGRWAAGARRFGLFVLFSVVGAGVAGVQLIPAVAYVTEHSRRTMTSVDAAAQDGRAWSSSWSLHPEEAVALVVPEFVGGDAGGAAWTSDTYWGRNVFKHNHEYLGLVALLLAGLSLLGGARPGLRWFLVALGAGAFLFALGAHTPVWGLFYGLVPGISLFRAPSMAIFLTAFAVATLAGFGLDRGVALVREEAGARVLRLLGIAAGVLALGWILAASGVLFDLWTSVVHPGLEGGKLARLEAARPHVVRGFLVAAALAGALGGAWWAFRERYLKVPGLVALVAVLLAFDQFRVAAPFVQVVDFHRYAAPDANDRFLIERARAEPPFRVLSLVQQGQDVSPALHGLELAAGHHPNDLGRYRELIGMVGSGLPEHLARFNPNVLDVLNVRYVLWPDYQYGPLEGAEPVSRVSLPDGRVYTSIYRYPALPRARLVGEALVVPEDRVLETVLDPGAYDPRREVVLAAGPPLSLEGPLEGGDVRWVQRTPNRLVLDVEVPAPALLVLSENWYPAWRASVDGEEAPVLRADHTLRAVPVPAGSHRVEMWFESPMIRAGLGVSLLSLVVLLVALGSGLAAERRSRQARTGMGVEG